MIIMDLPPPYYETVETDQDSCTWSEDETDGDSDTCMDEDSDNETVETEEEEETVVETVVETAGEVEWWKRGRWFVHDHVTWHMPVTVPVTVPCFQFIPE
jgi:hypothetical protein